MNKQTLHIVKIGGNVINNEEVLNQFLLDFSKLEGQKILVHGGGKKANNLIDSFGYVSKMINGRRVTDRSTLEMVTMVYAGLINKTIVAQLQGYGCSAIGLTGADANCIRAHKRIVKEIDYGFAGDVDEVNGEIIETFLNSKLTPVFCAITHDKKGQLLNTNADTIASELASALAKEYQVVLTYCFEKKGVLKDVNDDHSVIEKINAEIYKSLKEEKVIADGMLPKLENCFNALNKGVSKIIIGSPDAITIKNEAHTTLVL